MQPLVNPFEFSDGKQVRRGRETYSRSHGWLARSRGFVFSSALRAASASFLVNPSGLALVLQKDDFLEKSVLPAFPFGGHYHRLMQQIRRATGGGGGDSNSDRCHRAGRWALCKPRAHRLLSPSPHVFIRAPKIH